MGQYTRRACRKRTRRGSTHARVAELAGVGIDGPRAVDLAELALERSEPEAHLGGLAVRERLDRAFVDRPGRGETERGGRTGDVVSEHLRERTIVSEKG